MYYVPYIRLLYIAALIEIMLVSLSRMGYNYNSSLSSMSVVALPP